jgi:hypothetical protein
MAHVLVIGLPKGASQLVDRFATEAGLQLNRVYAEVGRSGALVLVPKPEHCLPEVHKYLDQYDSGTAAADFNGSRIVVLPYAELPPDCIRELQEAEALGVQVDFPDPNSDATWPKLSRKSRPDQAFQVALSARLQQHLLPVDTGLPPAEFIAKLASTCPRLLIAEGALDDCNAVAAHRYVFLRAAVTALVDAVEDDLSERFDEFCDKRGIHHAQTGGSLYSVTFAGTPKLAVVKCRTHLKRGDRTTREAAARVYYTFVDIDGVRHVALLHAGPHPSGDQKRRVVLPKKDE